MDKKKIKEEEKKIAEQRFVAKPEEFGIGKDFYKDASDDVKKQLDSIRELFEKAPKDEQNY